MTDSTPALALRHALQTDQVMDGAPPALLADRPCSLCSATGPALEFVASTIRSPHTRRAYARAVTDFLAWCEERAVPSIAAVQPLHVAAWIESQTREHSAPTVKQQLAAIRHLFDWLVIGQIVPLNPAASVRGPSHSVRRARPRCSTRRSRGR